jgi:hypothetical protein
MKKNIFTSFILLLSFALFTACGSNSKQDPEPVAGPYAFFNATTPLTVYDYEENNGTVEAGVYEIKVQLLKDGLAYPGQIVNMQPFDYKYGSVYAQTVITDANGYATFYYMVPEDYSKVKGENYTIEALYLDYEVDPANPDRAPKVLLRQDFEIRLR